MGVKAHEINVSYRVKIAITKFKVEAGRLRGCAPLTEAAAPVVAHHLGVGLPSVQDLPQVSVNPLERCAETYWTCWLDRIAQRK